MASGGTLDDTGVAGAHVQLAMLCPALLSIQKSNKLTQVLPAQNDYRMNQMQVNSALLYFDSKPSSPSLNQCLYSMQCLLSSQ